MLRGLGRLGARMAAYAQTLGLQFRLQRFDSDPPSGEVFTTSQTTLAMQDQMSFLIKSFLFFLIGLMFPTDLLQIALAGVAALFLLLFRIPAVMLSTKGLGPGKKEFWLLNVAMPRGLAAGVLATLPLQRGSAASMAWRILPRRFLPGSFLPCSSLRQGSQS